MKRRNKVTTLSLLTLGILSGGLLIAGGMTGNAILLGAGAAGLLLVCVSSIGLKRPQPLHYV